jgi:hypothetical protein
MPPKLYKELLAEREEIRREISNWIQEHDRLENTAVEKLAISTTIAALRIRLASVQLDILKMLS